MRAVLISGGQEWKAGTAAPSVSLCPAALARTTGYRRARAGRLWAIGCRGIIGGQVEVEACAGPYACSGVGLFGWWGCLSQA